MADSAVAITAGTGTNIDTRTEATNGNHRQVVVLGDPSTNAGVAPVDVTNGLSVTLTTALVAGTAAIGKLSANSGVDIGDVDVTSAVVTGGAVAHDGVGTGNNPLLVGGYASAAAPTDVSADGDAVRAWNLRNGARAVVLTAAGALIGGDATNGVDVDVTRMSALVAGTAAIGKLAANSGVDIGDVDVTSLPTLTNKQAYGSYTAMTVTNLQSLASSATAGWQSDRVDIQTSVKALDYEFFIKLTTANTAPANDKAAYVYLCPMITTDGGTTWLASDQGTATLPTGTQGTTTIATPNNLKLLGTLSYTTQQMVMQGSFLLSNAYGKSMPDGFSIIIINFTGAALSTSCVVAYRAITSTLS